MSLKQSLIDALDDLASSRSSIARRSRALDTIEQLLGRICIPNPSASDSDLEIFLDLQHNFECNVASRLMYSISASVPILQQSANSAYSDGVGPDPSISRIMIQSLSVLQGVALIHAASKVYLSKRWCIQVFVDLLSISRHTSPAPLSTSTNTAPAPSSIATPTLASSVIDTLLCVLVDAPAGLRAFEEVDGVEVVVKTLKRSGVARDIRIKCLEFLYFYLLDETTDISSLTTVSKHKFTQSSQGTPQSPTPFPSKLDLSTTSASSSRSASPDSTPRSPRKPASHLAFLRKDLDFVPMTPKKSQVSRLGVGTPRAGPGRTPYGLKLERTPSVDISITPASPTKIRRGVESSPAVRYAGKDESFPERRRTTQEKKEILSNLLGNVDSLVEGVARSGIWGLG